MRTSVTASLVLVTVLGAAACQPAPPPPPPPPVSPFDQGPAVITVERRSQTNRIELAGRGVQSTLLRSKYISAAEPSPDGTRLAVVQASGANGQLTVHPLRNGRLGDPTVRYRASIGSVLWSDDGSRIATSGASGTTWDGIDVIDAGTGALVRQIQPTHAVVPDFGCTIGTRVRLVPADWHPAGTHLLAYASVPGCEVVFVDLVEIDLATGRMVEIADLGVETSSASYSPDGTRILALGDNGTSAVIDRQTGAVRSLAVRTMPSWGKRGTAAVVEWGASGAIDVEIGDPTVIPWNPTISIPAPKALPPEWSADGTGLLVWSNLGLTLHPVGIDGHPLTVEVPDHADLLSMSVVRAFG